MAKIDFVIPWVDGGDPEWRALKDRYALGNSSFSSSLDANSECRFRENGLLRYWFRGIEAFAPWVNKVFFVTNGQKPSWLNLEHPQLQWVHHSDFIPERFLPTFNVNPIEMNFHRISGLSERFVYFNDDMFLTRKVTPAFFFKEGYPILDCDLRYTSQVGYNNWSRFVFNDYCLVNKSFDIADSIWFNRKKWFNIKELGCRRAGRNFLCFIANRSLPVGLYGHNALPHLKSTFQEIWDRFPEIMDKVCSFRFRSDEQVNQWLACAWNQAAGRFFPARHNSLGRIISIKTSNLDWICQVIRQQQFPQVCLNEDEKTTDADRCYESIAHAFESILPRKSSFELD